MGSWSKVVMLQVLFACSQKPPMWGQHVSGDLIYTTIHLLQLMVLSIISKWDKLPCSGRDALVSNDFNESGFNLLLFCSCHLCSSFFCSPEQHPSIILPLPGIGFTFPLHNSINDLNDRKLHSIKYSICIMYTHLLTHSLQVHLHTQDRGVSTRQGGNCPPFN